MLPQGKVFAFFEDGESWPKWFRAIHKVKWTSHKPYGLGTTRTVWLALATLDEHFFCWEQDRRCSFYLTGASMPLAHALAEDYLLKEVAPSKTRFTYSNGARATPRSRLGRSHLANVLRINVQERVQEPAELRS